VPAPVVETRLRREQKGGRCYLPCLADGDVQRAEPFYVGSKRKSAVGLESEAKSLT